MAPYILKRLPRISLALLQIPITPQTKKAVLANSVDSDETAHNESPHQDNSLFVLHSLNSEYDRLDEIFLKFCNQMFWRGSFEIQQRCFCQLRFLVTVDMCSSQILEE